ncbi:MAG: preprotein translocase subunit YajC [Selenomonadaceae bacterium]|nr:preprotein translocase subunit YajC [Selenomonadaceae bacterium]
MSPEMATGLASWGPILIMVLIFYFLLYRPQKNAQKKHKEMLDALKIGDRVVTIGGIYGTITGLEDKIIKLKVANNVEIELARSAINTNVASEEKVEQED